MSPGSTADSALERAVGMIRVKGVEVETHARKSDAAEALIEVAEECGADLIIVGNKGMKGADGSCSGASWTRSRTTPRAALLIRTTAWPLLRLRVSGFAKRRTGRRQSYN